MKLWICEKPSVARALAAVLAGNGKAIGKKGYIEIDGGKEIVSWCVGHILQGYSPEEYDEKWKKWDLKTLPILPAEWKLKPSDGTKEQFQILRGLISQAKELVNVGDPDREGQLLVDEVIYFLKKNSLPTTRCFISDMNPKAIKKSVAASLKQNNQNFVGLYLSGLGRQRADWLVGMNYSRAATLQAQKIGFQGVISIGRVQTPTLALIVNRDKEIENFKAQDYFNINAIFEKDGEKFKGAWTPKGFTAEELNRANTINKLEEASEEEIDESEVSTEVGKKERPAWLDESFRLIDENVAKDIIAKLKSAGKGSVVKSKKETKKENRPKLYSLSRLQSAMSAYGMAADETLAVCQKLYEEGYLTYPRTDSDFLPDTLKDEVNGVLANLSRLNVFAKYNTDENARNTIWNNEKTTVHHAIIPTEKAVSLNNLSNSEEAVYMTVAKAYFANFMDECIADVASIEIDCAGERFNLHGKIIREMGWKVLYQGAKIKDEEQELPKLEEGDVVILENAECSKSQTIPKSLFIEGKMPEIMKGVYKLVEDPEIRSKLKKLDGIGTEATRAKVIADLKKRGFIKTVEKGKKKYLTSTEIGRAVIDVLPDKLTSFILTSQWEAFLNLIETGSKSLEEFEQRQNLAINKMLEVFETTDFSGLKALSNSTGGGAKKSSAQPKKAEGKCPTCGGDLVIRTIKQGPKAGTQFISCANFTVNGCKYANWDVEIKKESKKSAGTAKKATKSTSSTTAVGTRPSFAIKKPQ